MYRGSSRSDERRPKSPKPAPVRPPQPPRVPDPPARPDPVERPLARPPVVSEKQQRPKSEPARDRRRGWHGNIEHQGFRGDGAVRELRQFRGVRMSGTRDEARRQLNLERRSRDERVDSVMWTLGVYRSVSRRAIVGSCFDGHPFAANPVLAKLNADGLIDIARVAVGKHGYQVYGLTKNGVNWLRDRLVSDRDEDSRKKKEKEEKEKKEKKTAWESWVADQRIWEGRLAPQQLRHDHQVFEAVAQDAEPELAAGGRIRRVRLDSEIRGLLASADAVARRKDGPAAALNARRAEGHRLGLTVFDEGAPIPDALVEIERRDGTVLTRAIEVATGSYTARQVAEKVRAGFQVYRVPNSRASGRRRRVMRVDQDMQLISFGGR